MDYTEKKRISDIKAVKEIQNTSKVYRSKAFYRLKKSIGKEDIILLSKLSEISNIDMDELKLLFVTSTSTQEELEATRKYVLESIQRFS